MPLTKDLIYKPAFKRSFELGLLPRLADILILAVTAHLASLLCFSTDLGSTAPIYRVLLYFCCGVAFFIFPHTGMYGSWRGRFMPSMLWRLTTAWALVLLHSNIPAIVNSHTTDTNPLKIRNNRFW